MTSVVWKIPRRATPEEVAKLRRGRRRRAFAKWRRRQPGEPIPEWLRRNA